MVNRTKQRSNGRSADFPKVVEIYPHRCNNSLSPMGDVLQNLEPGQDFPFFRRF